MLYRTKETFVNGCVSSAKVRIFPDYRPRWVHTGDEAYLNESAELFVVDRIKVSLESL